MNQPALGIQLHPTSLSNPYPIGDLGPAAIAFADFTDSRSTCAELTSFGLQNNEGVVHETS